MSSVSSAVSFIYPSNTMDRTQISKIQATAATKLQAHRRAQISRRITAARAAVSTRTAYKSYLASHTVQNTGNRPGWGGLALLNHFLPTLNDSFTKYKGLKIHLSAVAMYSMSFGDDWATMWIEGDNGQHHTTHIITITQESQIGPSLTALGEALRELITEAQLHGSGWVFDHLVKMELHVARYHPVGGAAMQWTLKPQLKAKEALINVQIRDDSWSPGESLESRPERLDWCFRYAVLSALHQPPNNPQKSAKYEEHMDSLNWSELTPDL
jgi:hypothetical protein